MAVSAIPDTAVGSAKGRSTSASMKRRPGLKYFSFWGLNNKVALDMLEEDLEEERFYVTVRRAYWAAAAGSPARKIADLLIQKLEF